MCALLLNTDRFSLAVAKIICGITAVVKEFVHRCKKTAIYAKHLSAFKMSRRH